ncbi:hypothetical protein AWC38_SpisGene22373 [Stylophora pistillata]|uniref:Uncharacterized protein n=1 Tax=Stylophora pistillata TaxID=50429 RepID=A0A2B4RAZ5_STYPI|nr:hypothetical protein AWC38_SpisGene22373 [Stylophora pistillata]
MALCEFSKPLGGPCSGSTDYPSNVACVSIGECDRDVKGHLRFCKVSGDIAVKNKRRLLLTRAVFRYSEPPNVLLVVGTEYQDGVREGRGGIGKRERAAKGDGQGNATVMSNKRRTMEIILMMEMNWTPNDDESDEDQEVIIAGKHLVLEKERYRESQQDWFGKRGMSWHIAVVFRQIEGTLQSQSFVHLMYSSAQDSLTVVHNWQHILKEIKDEDAGISQVYVRQDNAGCYHSNPTILAADIIEKSTGVHIKQIDFSDPQGKKGAGDRLTAPCKSHIRVYINGGHDVTTMEEVKTALLSNGGLDGVRVTVTPSSVFSDQEQSKITSVNKFNNFQYVKGSVIVWRAYGVGKGKMVTIKSSLTGKKQDPEKVAKDMCRARDENGARLFRIEEFLMPQQIAVFFSRLAVQSRQQVDAGEIHEEDISAIGEESNFDDVRKNVSQNVHLQHPIIVDQYDVCQLVHNKELKKITISMMEKLCLELGLASPNPPPPSVRRRVCYEQVLAKAVALCSYSVRGVF